MNNFIHIVSNMHLKNKILLLLASLLILILSASIFLENHTIVQKTKKTIYDGLIFEARQNADFINAKYFNTVEVISEVIKSMLLTHFNKAELHNPYYVFKEFEPEHIMFLSDILRVIPSLHGIAIYFQPSLYHGAVQEIPKVQVHIVDGEIIAIDKPLSLETINKNWFKKPFEIHKGVWSRPIILYGEKVLAYSIPVYLMEEPFAIVTLYLGYENIDSFINRFILRTTGYAYILNEDLVLLSHPHLKYFINTKLDVFIPTLMSMTKTNKMYDIVEYEFQNEQKVAVWHKLQNGDYLVLVGTTAELLKDIKDITVMSRIIAILFVFITLVVIYIVAMAIRMK